MNQYTIECEESVFNEMMQVMIDIVYKQEPINSLAYDKDNLFDALSALEAAWSKREQDKH